MIFQNFLKIILMDMDQNIDTIVVNLKIMEAIVPQLKEIMIIYLYMETWG